MEPELAQIERTQAQLPHTDSGWHSHLTHQIMYVRQGRLRVRFSEEKAELRPDDFVLIAPGHVHEIEGFEDYGLFVACIRCNASPQHYADSVGASLDVGVAEDCSLVVTDAPRFGRWLADMESYWRNGDWLRRLVCQGLLLRFLYELKGVDATRIRREDYRDARPRPGPGFYEVALTIERMYRDPTITVSDIARTNFVSRSYLYKLFRDRIGCGPKEYLQRLRLERAKEMMESRGVHLSQIARDVGFQDVYAFSRVFKRLMGYPPSQYRLHLGTSAAAPQEGGAPT